MNSAFTPEEIKKFLNNELDGDSEKAAVIADYLHGLSSEALDELLPDAAFLEGTPVEIPGTIQSVMRKQVKKAVKGNDGSWRKPLLIAACLIGFLLAGHFLLKLTVSQEVLSPVTFDLTRKSVANNTGTERYIHLPDGSGVLLKPGARISYQDNYKDNRFVYLDGQARFDVKHDPSKPFRVIASGIGTLDIGTSFWVDNDKKMGEITIKLLEGSIAVKSLENSFPDKNIYLQPGQQIKIFKREGHYLVSNLYPTKVIENKGVDPSALSDKTAITNWTNQAYSFSKSPLRKVFDQLSARYQVEIQVDPALLDNREFTGKIMYSDSLNVLLDAICNLNHLSYTRKGNKILVTK